jgi:hypothetical protein
VTSQAAQCHGPNALIFKKVYFCSPMKLFDIILLSLGVVFIIIGAYEVMAVGLGQAYTSLMLAMLMFFWFTYRKKSKA